MGYGQFIKCKHCGWEFTNYDGVGFAGKEIEQEHKRGYGTACCQQSYNCAEDIFFVFVDQSAGRGKYRA